MPTLLHLDSSADVINSVSRALTARFATTWTEISPEHMVVVRDLHLDPLPHLPTNALHWAPRLRTADEVVPAAAARLQQDLIDEVANADVLVIGAPMYNWGMPSTLKAWIDHIQVNGTTSPFDEPTQPFAGKPVVVVSARGAAYGPGTPGEGTDFETPGITQPLAVALGMDVTVVTAELTLATRVPAMAELAGQAADNLENAAAAMVDLARTLGTYGE